MTVKSLSIIVPAYKQEKTIIENIKSLDSALASLAIPYELIIVVDGFNDRTYELLKKIKNQKIKVLGYEKNMGKGFAIKLGIEKAKGEVVGFIDAGMDIDPTGISMLLNHMIWYNADIVVGSKLHPGSQVNYPILRKLFSWCYRLFTHFLFGFKVKDTQVGIKILKRKVAQEVFKKLLVKRFAFDIELLAVAYALGYKRIYEAPIKLEFNNNSSIPSMGSLKFWKIILNILKDTFGIYYRLKIVNYFLKKGSENSGNGRF